MAEHRVEGMLVAEPGAQVRDFEFDADRIKEDG